MIPSPGGFPIFIPPPPPEEDEDLPPARPRPAPRTALQSSGTIESAVVGGEYAASQGAAKPRVFFGGHAACGG